MQILAKKTPEFISVHDVWEPLKQALLASRDVIISSQICVSKLQRFSTLGDGCWLPICLLSTVRASWIQALWNHRGRNYSLRAQRPGSSPTEPHPVLLFLGVFVSLVFFSLQNSLAFLSVFCLFSRVLRVRKVRKSLVFLRFSLVFSKRSRKRRTRQTPKTSKKDTKKWLKSDFWQVTQKRHLGSWWKWLNGFWRS